MSNFIGFGNGKNGYFTGAGVVNSYASCTVTAGTPTVVTSLSVSLGDAVMLYQTYGVGVGTSDFVVVTGVGSGQFTVPSNILNNYTTGAQAVKLPQYNGGIISSSVYPSAWDGTSGGIAGILCAGNLTIGGSVSANGGGGWSYSNNPGGLDGGGIGGGYRGGNANMSNNGNGAIGQWGDGTLGLRNGGYPANGNGGGGGNLSNGGGKSVGGAGGGYATAGAGGNGNDSPGQGGNICGLPDFSSGIFFGGGGGGAGASWSDPWAHSVGGGGAGGGIVLIFAKNLLVTGSITCTGGNGSGADSWAQGGGGAGGSIYLKGMNLTVGSGLITANGGSGGGAGGGNGGVGRIRLECCNRSGTTVPVASEKIGGYAFCSSMLSMIT